MKKIINVLFVICLCVFLFSGYRLFNIYLEYKKGSTEYNEIQSKVEIKKAKDKKTKGNSLNPPIDIDFNKLEKVNSDIIGWIYVEALPNINYPILKGEDNSFYLRHTYKKTRNISGSIFADFRNSSDLMDYNTIIYGHNMKNGTMFSKLGELIDNPENTKKKPYIWILTPNKTLVYKIISIHREPYTSNTYTIYKTNGDEYYDYAKREFGKNQIKDLAINFNGNRMCTLSTCTDSDTVRMVVQGELVDTIVNK